MSASCFFPIQIEGEPLSTISIHIRLTKQNSKKRKIQNQNNVKYSTKMEHSVLLFSQNLAMTATSAGSIGFFTLIEPFISPLQTLLEKWFWMLDGEDSKKKQQIAN